ncbi:AI-2E family transporter [Fulvivirgaceae bacterium PWU4]|uniref:AI-2E family transporter n=1 Tax=Chryseosolibacter histidini TaxID=2782349 RepID=A0AAP2DPF1_9BACT|nr:AI-2E family transporter [Chryseosolibacter histidini]MBT1697859.1 AI-2E family transporter [Chryseosolibacter histidini]
MKEIFTRANQYLLFIVLLVLIFYFGRTFIIPIISAALLAMLMAPLCRRLDRWGFHRALSSFVCVFILLLVVLGILAIITAQFAAFAEDVSLIEKKSKEMILQGQTFIEEQFGISSEKQEAAVKEQVKGAGKSVGNFVAAFFGGLTSAIAGIVITLVFTFLFIFSKEKYNAFFLKLFKDKDPDKVKEVVEKVSDVSQKYLTGRAMSITIIAVLYAIGLSIVGIKNGILLAGIAAILTLIPYVGTVLGGLFPVTMALVTEDSMQPALLAIVVMFSIQTIDNYFIEPNIVGGEVNLSALASIISIIAGGLIWGVAGMVLFLPMTGIAKIICDHVESLKPIGYVIGDPGGNKSSRLREWIREKFSNKAGSRHKG